jgi:hypothetical protein
VLKDSGFDGWADDLGNGDDSGDVEVELVEPDRALQLAAAGGQPARDDVRPPMDYGVGRRCVVCGCKASRYAPPDPISKEPVCHRHWEIPDGWRVDAATLAVVHDGSDGAATEARAAFIKMLANTPGRQLPAGLVSGGRSKRAFADLAPSTQRKRRAESRRLWMALA